jgi:hypothetical protein
VKRKQTAIETFSLLHEAYGENTLSRAAVSEWHKRFSEEDDKRPGRPVTMKTDEKVGKVRTLVGTDRRLGIKMRAEELNMDKETVRQTSRTVKTTKVCAKMAPKNPPVFSHKTNSNTQARSVLTRTCPV